MVRSKLVTSLLATGAVALAFAGPAFADKKDRAQEAIAAAEAKVRTAESLGTGVEVPAATASARAALARAHEDLHAGHKSLAIDDAIHASALADTAIGEAQRRKDNALASAREGERAAAAAAVANAQDRASGAEDQAAAAQQQAQTAQQQAAEANARAAAAEQAAASSANDAANARAVAAAQAAQPTEVQTTITTQHRGTVHRTSKTAVVKRPPARTGAATTSATDQVTATTTVRQPPN